MAHWLHTGQNKELICRACDKKLLGVSNSGFLSDVIASGEGAQSSVHTVSGSNVLFDRSLGVLRRQNYPSMVPSMCTAQPASSSRSQIYSPPKSEEALYTNKSSVSTQVLYTCTCCRLQTSARRRYVIFKLSKYNIENASVAQAVEYQYSDPCNKELICRTCHTLLLKNILQQKALSSPAKDRPLPSSKCIMCRQSCEKKMTLFDCLVYGVNMKLDSMLASLEVSIDSIICSPCHTKYLQSSIVACIGCHSNVTRQKSMMFNRNQFPQHSQLIRGDSFDISDHQYVCLICHKSAIGEKLHCAICNRHVPSHHALLFDEANYDFKQYIVTKITQCAFSGVAAKSLICNQCHDTLKNSTDQAPIIPSKVRNPMLKSAFDFLKSVNDLPAYACTCCHRLLFRKTVKAFSLCDYDMDNPTVMKCLSHCVALCMDQATDLSGLFSAQKNMLTPGYSGRLCKG